MTYLAKQNPHERDAHIHFEEGPHKYTIQGIAGITPESAFTSVTTLVHQHFEQFDAKKIIAGMMRNQKKWNDPIANAKYYGKSAEEIEQMWSTAGRDAAMAGTDMHYKIECFYNTEPDTAAAAPAAPAPAAADTTPEFKYFLNFNRDCVATEPPKLRPYRTEWTVFHEESRIAGSIDMVYEVIDPAAPAAAAAAEVLAIYDWKRCREITKTNRANKFATHPAIEHIPDSNFWHYALQLNVYKYILQSKYGKTITDLYLVVLHPEAQNYQCVKLPDLQGEVAELFEERIRHFAAPAAAATE